MKKKQTKIKVIKTEQKGFPKDLTKAAAEKKQPVPVSSKINRERDPRIPAIGTVITRKYKGEELKVKVLENGFEYNGQTFKSISALAVHIVGMSVSGYVFFKLK
ncbi:MAG: DUF2924 domain-containing protein [Elusimicrobia bacterium]|nr:DUF2924 domain-containing protein [Elusimicrobiota bacterium]